MITVEVYRRPSKVSDEDLKQITKKLPLLTSEALNTLTGTISGPGDKFIKESSRVRVLVHDFEPSDMNTEDLEISIWARNYPTRTQNISERKEVITKGVKKIIDEIIATRKKMPSYITCEVELNLIFSSCEIIKSERGS